MEILESFAKVLRRLRLESGKSQEDFALEANIDRSYMSRLERGVPQPTLATIFKICENLEIAPSEFIRLIEIEMKSKPSAAIKKRIKRSHL